MSHGNLVTAFPSIFTDEEPMIVRDGPMTVDETMPVEVPGSLDDDEDVVPPPDSVVCGTVQVSPPPRTSAPALAARSRMPGFPFFAFFTSPSFPCS